MDMEVVELMMLGVQGRRGQDLIKKKKAVLLVWDNQTDRIK